MVVDIDCKVIDNQGKHEECGGDKQRNNGWSGGSKLGIDFATPKEICRWLNEFVSI